MAGQIRRILINLVTKLTRGGGAVVTLRESYSGRHAILEVKAGHRHMYTLKEVRPHAQVGTVQKILRNI